MTTSRYSLVSSDNPYQTRLFEFFERFGYPDTPVLLVEGGTNRSYGIQVARLAGIPEPVIKRSKTILSQIEEGSHPKAVEKKDARNRSQKKAGHVQLGLFSPMERKLVETLQMLDLGQMTPIEALNILNELQNKAQEVVY